MQGALPTWHPRNGEQQGDIVQVFDVRFEPDQLQPYKPFHLTMMVENISDTDLPLIYVKTKVDEAHFPQCPLTQSSAKLEALRQNEPKKLTLLVDINNSRQAASDFQHYPLAIAVLFFSDAQRKQKIHQHNVSLNSGAFPLLVNSSLTFPLVILTSRLLSFRLPGAPGKILLFGHAGSGKTTLIKTMLSALRGTIVFTGYGVSTTGATSRHQTTSYRKIELTPALHILDAWGLLEDNFTADDTVFRFMITGALSLDWQMQSAVRLLDPNVKAQMQRLDELRPDIMFFVFTPALIEDDGYLRRVKQLIRVTKEERDGAECFTLCSY